MSLDVRRSLIAFALAVSMAASAGCTPSRSTLRGRDLRATTLRTADGGRLQLGDGAGKVRLIAFFATWCFPCLIEIPMLEELSREHEGQGLSILAIGMDLDGGRVLQPFAELHGLSFPVLQASESMLEGRSAFGPLSVLPATFLFDRDGNLSEAWTGPVEKAELQRRVRALLK